MKLPLGGGLRWRIFISMLAVLSLGLFLYAWVSDNLWLTTLDRQLGEQLRLLGRMATESLPLRRMVTYVPGDERARIYTQDHERLLAFAQENHLDRILVLTLSGKVALDSALLSPGADIGYAPSGAKGIQPSEKMLYRDSQGRWSKSILWPVSTTGFLWLEAGSGMLEVIDRVWIRRWLSLSVGLALTFGLSALLVQWLGRRVSRLSAVFRALQNGHRQARAAIQGHDEIAYLGRVFNDMADELERRADQEHRDQERRLSELKILSAGVAHEIRNPLSAITGLADLLSRDPGITASVDAQDWLQRMRTEITRLDRIVREVLDYARQPRLTREKIPLAEILGWAKESDPACRIETTEENIHLFIDQSGLRTVIRNLVLNGRHAAGPQGCVTIGARIRPQRVMLTISDNGPGIPKEKISQLFQPFFSNKPGGTGLGLAIARNITEAHGGRLRLVSARQGAAFALVIPRTREV